MKNRISSTISYTPYLKIASGLATWLRIRILLVLLLIVIFILIVLSGLTYNSTSGDLLSYDTTSGLNSWNEEICMRSPYIYLKPFYFTFTSSDGVSYNNASYCAWPSSNSNLRLTITVTSFCVLIVLFMKTILSKFGRTILLLFTTLFFVSFIIDVNQTITGFDTCHTNFHGTSLGVIIETSNITISCYNSYEIAILLLDLLTCFLFYLTFECWGMCSNLYNIKKNLRANQQSLPKKRQEVNNPLHNQKVVNKQVNNKKIKQEEDINYAPYEHEDTTDYTPYDPEDNTNYAPYEHEDTHNYAPYEHVDDTNYLPYEPDNNESNFEGDRLSNIKSIDRKSNNSAPIKLKSINQSNSKSKSNSCYLF